MKTEIESLATRIVSASGVMPNPSAHSHWLQSLPVEVLRERLRIITGQSAGERWAGMFTPVLRQDGKCGARNCEAGG